MSILTVDNSYFKIYGYEFLKVARKFEVVIKSRDLEPATG